MATADFLLLKPALRKLGIVNPQVDKRKNCLAALNAFLGSLGAERNMIFSLTRENFTLTINDAEYTIGSSGNFNTVRPTRIEHAYLRDGTTDERLVCRNIKDYNDISTKTSKGKPTRIYYLPEYPLGKILFNLEPDKAYVLYTDSWKPLTTLSKITTQVSFPPEYEEPLIYNLALRMAGEHDSTLTDDDRRIAIEGLRRIKSVNAEPPGKFNFNFLPIYQPKFDVMTGGQL